MIQIDQINHNNGENRVNLGCTCGLPSIALYPCEDDEIIFCTHCGEITTRERLINESSTPHLRDAFEWANVSNRTECPLINVSIPLNVWAHPERGPQRPVVIKALITKISAEKCFLRLEVPSSEAVLHRQQELDLVSGQPPIGGRISGIVEEILWPSGAQGPTYYKVRLVPLTVEHKAALENFFASSCGLQFNSHVLAYTPAPAFKDLRRMLCESLPKARVHRASSENEFLGLLKELNPAFCLLPVLPPLLEEMGHKYGEDHPAHPHVILLLEERNPGTIREAILWGADDILYPDSGKENLSRVIQRCLESDGVRNSDTGNGISSCGSPSLGAGNCSSPSVSEGHSAPQSGAEPPARTVHDPSETISRIGRPRASIGDEDVVRMLCMASETHDSHSSNHLNRISAYTAAIARKLSMPAARVAALATASKLHDVGKLGVPDEILKKTGALTADERRVMQEHTRFGYRILEASSSELMRLGAQIALRHHERTDGAGYPDGLAGDAIPIEARIVTVADVFDALTNQRAYKPAWSNEKAVEHLQEQAGRMFAPEVIEAFLRVLPEIERTQLRFMDDFRDVWTERRRHPRRPTQALPVTVEIAMPELTFRPRGLPGELQNLSGGGLRVLLREVSLDLFTMLVSTRRYAKVTCTEPGWTSLTQATCSVTWVDYYAIPEADGCLIGMSFQKPPPDLEQMLGHLEEEL